MHRQDHQVQQGNSVSVAHDRKDRQERIHGQEPKDRLTVAFRSIQIREFDRVVGDHPDVTNGGPPLTIGWDYLQRPDLNLEDYENAKAKRATQVRVRRLSSGTRRDLLRIDFQVPLEEILKAEKQVERAKKQRAQSNQPTNKVLGIMEAAKRKLSRRFSRELVDRPAGSKRQDLEDAPTSATATSTSTRVAFMYQRQQSQPIPAMPLPTPTRMREISV